MTTPELPFTTHRNGGFQLDVPDNCVVDEFFPIIDITGPDDSFHLLCNVLHSAEEKACAFDNLDMVSLYEKYDPDISLVHYTTVAGRYPGKELADYIHRDKTTLGSYELRRVIDLMESAAAEFIVSGVGHYEQHASVIQKMLDSFRFNFDDWKNAQAKQAIIDDRERKIWLKKIDQSDLPNFPEEIKHLALATKILLSNITRDGLEEYDSSILEAALDDRLSGLTASEAKKIVEADMKSLNAWIEEEPTEREFLSLLCDIMEFRVNEEDFRR